MKLCQSVNGIVTKRCDMQLSVISVIINHLFLPFFRLFLHKKTYHLLFQPDVTALQQRQHVLKLKTGFQIQYIIG